MSEQRRSSNPLVWFFRGLWGALDGLRKVIHLVILLVVALVVVAALTPERPVVPANAALVLAPSGQLVDELSGRPLDRALAAAQGLPAQETRLRDLLEALHAARDDERIPAVVLDLSMMTGGGLSHLHALAAAVRDLRDSGKPVIAWGEGFSQGDYLIASQADELLLHPSGGVLLQGFGSYRPFIRRALDTLLIDVEVISVGDFKSDVETFTRDDLSEGGREITREWLESLWQGYRERVAVGRDLDPEALQQLIEQTLPRLEAAGGSLATFALEAGLVDALVHRDEFEARMRELVAAEEQGFRAIQHTEYLAARRASGDMRARLKREQNTDRVAVITATGIILPGEQAPGAIGSETLSRLIRQAADDERVRALVLRVDSGGGSAFASDVIYRELERVRQSGRPVVISMSSLAASGGYLFALAGDEIWASPSTLTGSIGVYLLFPTIPRALDRLGIGIDGVATTWLASELRVDRPLGADARRLLELTAEEAYTRFTDLVKDRRGLDADAVASVAEGRLFSGADAQAVGLVDGLGELDDAVASAASLAGLEDGAWVVRHIEPELGLAQRLAMGLLSVGRPGLAVAQAIRGTESTGGMLHTLAAQLQRELQVIRAFDDPRGVAAYCFACETLDP
ncbi:MAG: signal peptide peptidase SppA [Gammaproteobacteria bacterium]|nr:MAG: signal peptide peptidase SppA [Gammaproteobacteria bacterium]